MCVLYVCAFLSFSVVTKKRPQSLKIVTLGKGFGWSMAWFYCGFCVICASGILVVGILDGLDLFGERYWCLH